MEEYMHSLPKLLFCHTFKVHVLNHNSIHNGFVNSFTYIKCTCELHKLLKVM
jgi:hypothetical protein